MTDVENGMWAREDVERLHEESQRAWTRLRNLRALGPKYADLVEAAAPNARAASRRYIDAEMSVYRREILADREARKHGSDGGGR